MSFNFSLASLKILSFVLCIANFNTSFVIYIFSKKLVETFEYREHRLS